MYWVIWQDLNQGYYPAVFLCEEKACEVAASLKGFCEPERVNLLEVALQAASNE